MSETQARTFSGAEQAAIFLLVLGEEEASRVLKHMDPEELQLLGEAMTGIKDISQRDIFSVFANFQQQSNEKTPLDIGNYDYLRKILMQALGGKKASSILSKIVMGPDSKGIEALQWMTSEAIVTVIQDEHPQIIATLLTQLNAELAGEILERLPESIRTDVIRRVALTESINESALTELDELIEDHFKRDKPGKVPSVGGPAIAANILNNTNASFEAAVIEELSEQDRPLSEKIRGLMFVFDNLLDVDDRGVQSILRESPQDKLVIALKGASPDVRAKILKNMSKRAAEMLQDDLETLGPTKVSDVEDAQKEILEVAMRLKEEGKIIIGGGGDDFV